MITEIKNNNQKQKNISTLNRNQNNKLKPVEYNKFKLKNHVN